MKDDFLDAIRYLYMKLTEQGYFPHPNCRCTILPSDVFLFYRYKVNINYFIYN